MVGSFSCKYGNTREGVASFINPAKLVLVDVATIKITEAMKTSLIWANLEKNESLKTRLEERNTVLQISVLETKTADKSLIVLGNTLYIFAFGETGSQKTFKVRSRCSCHRVFLCL